MIVCRLHNVRKSVFFLEMIGRIFCATVPILKSGIANNILVNFWFCELFLKIHIFLRIFEDTVIGKKMAKDLGRTKVLITFPEKGCPVQQSVQYMWSDKSTSLKSVDSLYKNPWHYAMTWPMLVTQSVWSSTYWSRPMHHKNITMCCYHLKLQRLNLHNHTFPVSASNLEPNQ